MKKIGIISDTHGLLRPEILEILNGCDCIIHAGDVNKPEILDTLRMMGSIYVVRGNNHTIYNRRNKIFHNSK